MPQARGQGGEVINRARELRKRQTEAETILWNFLRARKLAGLKFRRQYAIERMILDFYCAERKLCIEVDGSIHRLPKQMERDRERTKALNQMGIRVIRFENSQVMQNIGAVLESIRSVCDD